MSGEVARKAAEIVSGERLLAPQILATGRSSVAWGIAGVGKSATVWIVRVPIEGSGRRISYRSEQLIGNRLSGLGHPVASWAVVTVDGRECSVGRRLPGAPIDYDEAWSNAFSQALAVALFDLHTMPSSGFGPLANDSHRAEGISESRRAGVVDRWFHARVLPFDDSGFDDHPIMDLAHALGARVAVMIDEITAAESGRIGLVHSDLHREHLLVNRDGSLAGILDFGDAFIGAVAWDFATVNWYYGKQNAERLAAYYPEGSDELRRGCLLSVAVGLYKAAKNPGDRSVLPRLERCVSLAERLIGQG